MYGKVGGSWVGMGTGKVQGARLLVNQASCCSSSPAVSMPTIVLGNAALFSCAGMPFLSALPRH